MKKTLLFVLGALLVSVLPGKALQAQSGNNVSLSVTLRTLNNVPVKSAAIYAATTGQRYCANTASLDPTWSGTAVPMSTLTNTALSFVTNVHPVNGTVTTVTGTVDATVYGTAFVVVTDSNDHYYVLGTATRAQRDTGYFMASNLFATLGEGETFTAAMLPNSHMLGTERSVIIANNNPYSRLDLALASGEMMLEFTDTVRVDYPSVSDSMVVIMQMGYPLISTYTGTSPLITFRGTQASVWTCSYSSDMCDVIVPDGFGPVAVATGVQHLAISNIRSGCKHGFVKAYNTANVVFGDCQFTATDADEAFFIVADTAMARVSWNNTCASGKLVDFDNNSYGIGLVLQSQVAAMNGKIGGAVHGNLRRYLGNDVRIYRRTLDQMLLLAGDTAEQHLMQDIHDLNPTSKGDSLVLMKDVSATANTIITSPMVLDLGTHQISGSLQMAHNDGIVVLQNGTVSNITAANGALGTVIANIDLPGTFDVKNLDVRILGGRYLYVLPRTGANVKIDAGKFADDLSNYLTSRHAIVANEDADATPYAYKVVDGYSVTFVDYNARRGQTGYQDSVAVVNQVDNRLRPAASRPTYVGSDSIFANYWVDSTFTTPWNFLRDVLTSDTTLYARWYKMLPGQSYNLYSVEYWGRSLDGGWERLDTMALVDDAATLCLHYYPYHGFYPVSGRSITDSLVPSPVNGTVYQLHYERDTFNIVWHTAGGQLLSLTDSVQPVAYEANIVYPTVQKIGQSLIGWTSTYGGTTMPDYDIEYTAHYAPNSYPLSWRGANSVVEYNGQPVTSVSASYIDDFGDTVNAVLSFVNANGDTLTQAVDAGRYTVYAAAADPRYTLKGSLSTELIIKPATIVVEGIEVVKIKEYDGNVNAEITNAGVVSVITQNGNKEPLYGNDDVTVTTTAVYNNANAGTGKAITAISTLSGADIQNYSPVVVTQVITNDGIILEKIVFNNGVADNGIEANAEGYCSGDNSGFKYYLQSGNVNQYTLYYSDAAHAQGFVDVDSWNMIVNSGIINIVVPAGAQGGVYNARLVLRNGTYPQFESNGINVTFTVNIPKDVIRPLFNDMITVIDTSHTIDQNNVVWLHRSAAPAAWDTVGRGPWYKEPGGLTGEYKALIPYLNGNVGFTCPQDRLGSDNYPDEVAAFTVSAYPNPTTDRVNVHLDNARISSHTLRVMNIVGVVLIEANFDGNQTSVDFTNLPLGNYTLSVDGTVVRVIKK